MAPLTSCSVEAFDSSSKTTFALKSALYVFFLGAHSFSPENFLKYSDFLTSCLKSHFSIFLLKMIV